MGLDVYGLTACVKCDHKDEFFYWRNHRDMVQWAQNRYLDRGEKLEEDGFNGVEFELNKDDIDNLELLLLRTKVDNEYMGFYDVEEPEENIKKDLQFVEEAREKLFNQRKIYFMASW